jgi:hypothetical protein
MGRLSHQVKATPWSDLSKNRPGTVHLSAGMLESRKEHPRGKKKAREALTDLYKLTFSSLGPTSYVNLPLVHNYLTTAMVYKRPPTLQQGVRDHFPLDHANFLSSLFTPLQPLFIFNIKLMDVGLLPLRRGLNQDRS